MTDRDPRSQRGHRPALPDEQHLDLCRRELVPRPAVRVPAQHHGHQRDDGDIRGGAGG